LRVVLPRVYLTEQQIRKHSVEWPRDEKFRKLMDRLAPGAEVLYFSRPMEVDGLTSVMISKDGRLDFGWVLCTLWPAEDVGELRLACLLRS
jgi:hypothetical protein